MQSFSSKLYKTIILLSVLLIGTMVLLVHFVGEDLEKTIVDISFIEENRLIQSNFTDKGLFIMDEKLQKIAYIPTGIDRPESFPTLFIDFDEGVFKEVVIDGETYIGRMQQLEGGQLFYAKNITVFENKETLFARLLWGIGLLMVIFSAFLAYLASGRLAKPWQQMTQSIASTPIGKEIPSINEAYEEKELHEIAVNFNHFTSELNAYVKRENAMLSLASHELRTPIAVIAGALDIIESRDQLTEKDKITVARIRAASDEMGMNIDVLLKLARNKHQANTVNEVFVLNELLAQVKEDLSNIYPEERISLQGDKNIVVNSDITMVKMLIRNLVQNALHHTRGKIAILLNENSIDIVDEGQGLSKEQQNRLLQDTQIAGLDGLGLYIVRLLSERVNWPLSIVKTDANGTILRLDFRLSLVTVTLV